MHIETLCTGDELLTGLTLDSNGRYLQGLLLERLGLRVRRGTVVGDEREALESALREAAQRAEVLVVSGGLGPTSDDITAECAAAAAGVPLALSAEVEAHLEARATHLGIGLTPGSRKQAWLPRGARHWLSALGSAPMQQLAIGACTVFLLPGPPREFRAFAKGALVEALEAQLAGRRRLRHGLWRMQTAGKAESEIEALVAPLAREFEGLKLGYRVHPPYTEIKFLCTAWTQEALEALGASIVAKARGLLGTALVGEGPTGPAAGVVGLLRRRGETLALAESCTGGRIAAALTAVPGASECFTGGAVVYSGEAKLRITGLKQEVLEAYGEVSAETTRHLAAGVRAQLGADWGLATTGYAGPGGAQPGLCFVACEGPGGKRAEAQLFHKGNRQEVQEVGAGRALELLRGLLRPPGGG